MRSSLQRVQMLVMAASLALLLLVSGPALHLPVAAQSASPPPYARAPWGIQPPAAWSSSGALSAGSNPLNKADTGSSCSSAAIDSVYYFNVWENYQQLVTFFPAACAATLVVQINAVPSVNKQRRRKEDKEEICVDRAATR